MAFPMISMDSTPANNSMALPLPGPLPLGDGESLAIFSSYRSRNWHDARRNNCDIRWPFPSPSGRGIKGEGEPLCLQQRGFYLPQSVHSSLLGRLATLGLIAFFVSALFSWTVGAAVADESQLIAVLQSAASPTE